MELKCSLFIYIVVLILLGHSIIALHGGMNVKNTDETNLRVKVRDRATCFCFESWGSLHDFAGLEPPELLKRYHKTESMRASFYIILQPRDALQIRKCTFCVSVLRFET